MRLAIALCGAAAFLAVYVIWIRPHLKSLPGLSAAFSKETSLSAALKTYLEGRKTIFVGLWGTIIGVGPDVLQILGGVDLKTAIGLPDNWAIIISGLLVPLLMLIFRSKAKV